MPCCLKCTKELAPLDIAMHRKMVNRKADSFMCLDCLGEHFNITREMLEEKAEQFKKNGCSLFL